MTLQRAVAYIGGAALLCAWFASAASTSRAARDRVPAVASARASQAETEVLARDIQRQAARLRKRLAAAPSPQRPARNPFSFGDPPVESASPRAVVPRLAPPPPVAALPDEPPLVLIGIAEQGSGDGRVRTAMIAAEGDQLFLVKPGDSVLGRYQVEIVGADAVQLKDLAAAGAPRRLALR